MEMMESELFLRSFKKLRNRLISVPSMLLPLIISKQTKPLPFLFQLYPLHPSVLINAPECKRISICLYNYHIKEMKQKQQQNLKDFLHKYHEELTKEVKQTPLELIKAELLSQDQLQEAAMLIRNGKLVAFPTETVYGLGANAYDEEALKSIYVTKKRPLTDPIIVHVLDAKQGEKLVIMDDGQRKIFEILTKQFWPGPLTVILKANLDLLPMIVTAQTGFVGIRAPKHPYARALIQKSGLPIGAPSANLFSHVSPTEPVHVFNDFYNCEISIVDGKRCEYGVESTVVKIVGDELHVFRQGSLSVRHLQNYLKKTLPQNELPKVIVHKRIENKHTNMQAPGQLLKHYAPYLPCYILQDHHLSKQYQNQQNQHTFELLNTAFIAFGSKFDHFKDNCKSFFKVGQNILQTTEKTQEQDLFCSKQEKEMMREIYYLLRKCQNLQVQAIVIGWSDPKEGTVWDKIFRSTQGQTLTPNPQ